jgi:hypothetical protein
MQQEMIKTGEIGVGSSEPKKEGKDTASFAGEGRRLGGAETKGHELA